MIYNIEKNMFNIRALNQLKLIFFLPCLYTSLHTALNYILLGAKSSFLKS